MRFVRLVSLVFAVGFSALGARAGDDLVIPLKFIPTVNPVKVRPSLREGISAKPVAIAVEDARAVKSRDLVGEGTGFGDDTFLIRYAGHLPSYLKNVIQDRLQTWGVEIDDKSNLVLTVKATRFHVLETHAFYGSQFSAEVQLPWSLGDRAGHVFASGTALGTGKTKGRWRNPVNCEEVLADALQSATFALAGESSLQEAWLAAVPQSAPAPAPVAVAVAAPKLTRSAPTIGKTPAQLLVDVNKLRHEQLATHLLVEYVSKQTLASGFSASDLVAWKKAGVPDPVMQAALRNSP